MHPRFVLVLFTHEPSHLLLRHQVVLFRRLPHSTASALAKLNVAKSFCARRRLFSFRFVRTIFDAKCRVVANDNRPKNDRSDFETVVSSWIYAMHGAMAFTMQNFICCTRDPNFSNFNNFERSRRHIARTHDTRKWQRRQRMCFFVFVGIILAGLWP